MKIGSPRRYRRLLGPGIMTVVMVLILLALGTWQVHRLAWKEAILARIAAAEAGPAIKLPTHPGPYAKVQVTGRFHRERTALFADEVHDTPMGPQMGAELIVALERAAGPPVLVDRGWIPLSVKAPVAWPDGPVTVDGYVQAPQKPGLFTPAPDMAQRRFYALDPAAIGAALGLKQVAPFTLIELGPLRPGQYPRPAQHLPRPPNHHLIYAIIWYTLAGALLMVFAVWSREVLADERL